MLCYDRPRARATARDLQGEPRASAAAPAIPRRVHAPSLRSSGAALIPATLPAAALDQSGNWLSQIANAVMYVILSALEWVFGAILMALSFILTRYFDALTHGEPWALVILGLVGLLGAYAIFGGGSGHGVPCGTCGGRGKKHERWCKKQGWGGQKG